MTLKLFVFPASPRSFKVLWAANHLGLGYDLVYTDFATGAHVTPEMKARNPNAKLPVLDDDGFVLWESNAIVEYLASKKATAGLLPEDVRGRLSICKWLFWESAHWDPACAVFAFERVVKPMFGRGQADPAEIARGTELFKRVGPVLDGELAKHRFVAGDTLTAADISIGAAMCIADQAGFPIEPYRGIQRWYAEIRALPSWTKTTALQVPPQRAA